MIVDENKTENQALLDHQNELNSPSHREEFLLKSYHDGINFRGWRAIKDKRERQLGQRFHFLGFQEGESYAQWFVKVTLSGAFFGFIMGLMAAASDDNLEHPEYLYCGVSIGAVLPNLILMLYYLMYQCARQYSICNDPEKKYKDYLNEIPIIKNPKEIIKEFKYNIKQHGIKKNSINEKAIKKAMKNFILEFWYPGYVSTIRNVYDKFKEIFPNMTDKDYRNKIAVVREGVLIITNIKKYGLSKLVDNIYSIVLPEIHAFLSYENDYGAIAELNSP